MPIILNDTNIIVQNGYILEDRFTTTSNLTAEPYIESEQEEERLYPPLRLFTTNNLTLTSEYYVSIEGGVTHTVLLTNEGKVYTCGENTLGGSENITTPELISTNIAGTLTPFDTLKISAIACGEYYTIFLTNEGNVYSCGKNEKGQLGLGNTTQQTTPQQISSLNSFKISAIACGYRHTIFLTIEGNVYSCGDNYDGQLGIGNRTQQTTPQPISSLNSFKISAIVCGYHHTMFLTNEGNVYSCGWNFYGQLGTGDTTTQSVPQLLLTLNSFKISAIACGNAFSIFLTNNGKVYSCGYNRYGQLGSTTNIEEDLTPTPNPTLITTNIDGTTTPFNSLTISAIACGQNHTIFLTNDGKVYSCGDNTHDQLGINNYLETNPYPILITTLNSLIISAISGGGIHTLFLSNVGKVYSCGNNEFSQLGRTTSGSVIDTQPSIVDTFPSSTIYGSGLYTVSYSSFTSSFEPFKCFNENSTANNQGTWRSGDYRSVGLFNSATYSTSNLVSGYDGDWLVIKLPVSIKLKRFVIKQISTALNSAPRNFRLYGSTNGTSWTLLIDKQDAVYTSLSYNHTDMLQYASNTRYYYNHFGLVVNALVGSATTLSFDEFYVYGFDSPYTIITNGNTKTLTIQNLLNSTFVKSYNITFPVPTFANINNNSNLILQGKYDINLISSTSNTIVSKSGQYISSSALSLATSNVSIRYSLINPINNIKNNYIIETVKSDLFIPDLVTSTSNLTAEPYLESGERLYPVSRLFTTNNLTLTNYYVSIACGGFHTVFLTNDGKVYSCGLNTDGQLGRTGDGSVPGLINTTTVGGTPTAFNDLTITAIASRGSYTVFLTNDGKVYSCGSNSDGQLGRTGTTTVPGLINTTTVGGTPTAFNNLTITAIACGYTHLIFLTNDGKVYSCGSVEHTTYNQNYGQLGRTGDGSVPGLINTTTVGGTPTAFNNLTISAIAGGYFHTVFLTNDGKVYSCGWNSRGQLGITTNSGTDTVNPSPTLITTTTVGGTTTAFNNLTISAIACGDYHTVFLTNDGKVYSCGSNGGGQLGIITNFGTTTANPSPALITTTTVGGTPTAFNNLTITAIACGSVHTTFLTNDGKVYSCGYNFNDQFGISTASLQNSSPILISTLNSLTISAIYCGSGFHTMFLTNEGKVYSCGDNTNDQLGQSTSTTTPSIVNPSSSIYGSGLYTVSYSSFTSSFEPFKCFNENSTADNQGTWRSGDYLSTGLFDSTTYSTSNLVSGYNGDWLVIKLPLSIKLKRFAIKQISTALNSAPRNFRLYGSTTGTSWTLLIDKQDAVYTSLSYNHTDMSQYASDTNKYYNHFGLVVNALVGSSTTLSFDEFFVYGIESVPYTPITNANTKTLTIPKYTLNNSFLKSYNITFPVPTFANINNNSNLLLQGEYGINLINSTSNTIVPKSGQYIPSPALSLATSNVSIRYSLINPIKDIKGAQWTYNSLNTSVYHMGNVGIGTTNPEYQLDVRGNIYSSTGGLTQSGLTTWTVLSDRRIKENIVKASYEKCLDNVKNIELYNFNFKDNYVSTNDRHQLGFIAQEVQTVYPKAVEVGNITLNVEEKIDDLLTLNTTQIDYTLYGAVKNLIETVENLEDELTYIENNINL